VSSDKLSGVQLSATPTKLTELPRRIENILAAKNGA
jgi:hypothetical protein